MNMNLKQKNDTDCNFYHVSILVPTPYKFLLVCLCILVFHGIYHPPPTTKIFLYLVAKGWENFKNSWGPSVLGETNILFGSEARPFSSIKPSMTNRVNSRIVEGKIICFMCVC